METIDERIAKLEEHREKLTGLLIAHHLVLVKVMESSPAARATLAQIEPKKAVDFFMSQPLSDLSLATLEQELERIQRPGRSHPDK